MDFNDSYNLIRFKDTYLSNPSCVGRGGMASQTTLVAMNTVENSGMAI